MPSTLGIVASGEDVFNDAVLWLDTARSVANETTMVNYGKGGSALNATYGSSAGADTNDPLLLTHSGTNYLYLPGLAGNSVSCTAPGTAVSYAATPIGGGGDTTGAATGGAAFTFSTSGSWSSVRLLNAGGSTVAQFTVNAGNQTALTDSFGVVWALNRSTSGRKAVAVVRNVLLFGTDDYLQVADNDLVDFTASDSWTLVATVRQWGSIAQVSHIVSKQVAAGTGARWRLSTPTSSLAPNGVLGDGTNAASATAAAPTSGALSTFTMVVNRTTNQMTVYTDNTPGSAVSTSAVGSSANALNLRIGAPPDTVATNTYNGEVLSVAIWRRVLTTNEIATAAARYA